MSFCEKGKAIGFSKVVTLDQKFFCPIDIFYNSCNAQKGLNQDLAKLNLVQNKKLAMLVDAFCEKCKAIGLPKLPIWDQ